MAGKSASTQVIAFRLPNELVKILDRRADKDWGGSRSEYARVQMTFILTRKHRRTRGLR